MKTAEELAKDFIAGFMASHTSDYVFNSIRKIQLDAMKGGARRAAVIAEGTTFAAGKHTEWEDAYDKGCKDSEEAILTAANNWTEKDL